MDIINDERDKIEEVLRERASIPYSHGKICLETVFDRASHRYVLLLVGWDGIRRVHGCLVHVDIIDGKIWIQRDGTEHGIARDLLEAGIPLERMVLAFRPPGMREPDRFAAVKAP